MACEKIGVPSGNILTSEVLADILHELEQIFGGTV